MRNVLGIVLVVLVAPAQAQNWDAVKLVAAGSQVRIDAGKHTFRGTVRSVTDESLALESSGGQQVLQRRDIGRVSVRSGSSRGRHVLVGALIGGAAGAALGGVAAGACRDSICGGHGPKFIGGLGGAGAAVGALFGLIPTGEWREIYKQ
jgi:hypothetical protein